MKVTLVTPDVVKASSRSEYNRYEWHRTVDRFSTYGNPKFYKNVEKEDFYCVYQTSEGITFFKEISYASMLSSASFIGVDIDTDGNVEFVKIQGGRISNSPQGRRFMAQRSQTFGAIFTNEF